jgi:hypothetical protein
MMKASLLSFDSRRGAAAGMLLLLMTMLLLLLLAPTAQVRHVVVLHVFVTWVLVCFCSHHLRGHFMFVVGVQRVPVPVLQRHQVHPET